MQPRFSIGLWPRLVFFAIAIALLGLAPRPHAYRQNLELARRALEGGRPREAAAALQVAAEISPGHSDLWEQAGLAWAGAGDYSAAASALETARRQGGDAALTPPAWVALGTAYYAGGATAEAVTIWNRALELYGPDGSILDHLTNAHLKLGDWAAAADDIRKNVALSPTSPELYYRLGLILSVVDPESALDALDHAAGLEPHYAAAAADIRRAVLGARLSDSPAYTQVTVGRALAGLGEWDAAAESFRRAVRLRPDYAEAWAYLGEALQHPGEGTLTLSADPSAVGALQALQTALKLDPQSFSARAFLALYWTRQGDPVQALETLREAAALDPNNPALQVQLGSLMAETGDLAGAQACYERAIDLSPYDPAYRRALIEFFVDYDYQVDALALPLARKLVAASPDDPAALTVMGRVLLKQNDLSGAERFLRRALEQDARNAAAHMYLGLVYALRGERDAARSELLQAAQLDLNGPVETQARRLLQTYFP